MRRNPKLAQEVSQQPDIQELKHKAIDKLTSAHLHVDIKARRPNMPEIDELIFEDKLDELINEAAYWWHRYRIAKKAQYDIKIHDTIEKGNKEIMYHSKILDELKSERGLQ